MGSVVNPTKHFLKVTPNLYNLFQSIEVKGILPSPFYEVSIILIAKTGKNIVRKEIYRPIISHEHRCKTVQNICKLNPTIYKKNYILQPSGIYPR